MTGLGARAAVPPMMSVKLDGIIGAKSAKPLESKLQLRTIEDLLRHYPRRYRRLGEISPLNELQVGEQASFLATVTKVALKQVTKNGRPLRILTLTLKADGTSIECTFFNQNYLARLFTVGKSGLFSGKIQRFGRTLQLKAPVGEPFEDSTDDSGKRIEKIEQFGSGILPIYALADGVKQAMLQQSMKTVLQHVEEIDDPLPAALRTRHGLVDLRTALVDIHRPTSDDALEKAQHRLRYDEALSMQLVLAQRRARAKAFPAEPCPVIEGGLLSSFDATIPFQLTAGQQEVGRTISEDLASTAPMSRLLQGEVGSGKTVVALRAMLQVIDAARQTALLAPTEVLVAQHARSLRAILGPLATAGQFGAPTPATRVSLLTGSLPVAARRQVLLDIASGEAGIVIGTHALLGKDVIFADLGMVVIDEQHRFGVEQRDELRSKSPTNNPPHVLVMTATPIPRTVAMTVFGDLDTSTLRELPVGRSPIETTVVPAAIKPAWLARAWQRVREEVGKGRQVYVVCPRIGGDGAETDEAADDFDTDGGEQRPPLAVVDVAAELSGGPLAGLRLGILHGRLVPADKDAVMQSFQAGDLDVLVATTVIEVGVDVSNATMMIVMDADRFGISQLHQLRGRVGRGTERGICLLVTHTPEQTPARQRLTAVAATTDGFILAKADLAQRREGNVLGKAQAGRASGVKLLSLLRDETVIDQAREDAGRLIDKDPQLKDWPGLRSMVAATLDAQSQEFLDKT